MDDGGDLSRPDEEDDWVICKCLICKSTRVPPGTKRQHMRIFGDPVDQQKASTKSVRVSSYLFVFHLLTFPLAPGG